MGVHLSRPLSAYANHGPKHSRAWYDNDISMWSQAGYVACLQAMQDMCMHAQEPSWIQVLTILWPMTEICSSEGCSAT